MEKFFKAVEKIVSISALKKNNTIDYISPMKNNSLETFYSEIVRVLTT